MTIIKDITIAWTAIRFLTLFPDYFLDLTVHISLPPAHPTLVTLVCFLSNHGYEHTRTKALPLPEILP